MDFNFDNLNENTDEGKLLLSAICILTTNEFCFMGEKIDGTKKHPNEIVELLKTLSNNIYKSEDK